MYERDERHFIDDIVDSIQAIEEFTDGMNCEAFVADRKTYSATLREFIVIGEAVSQLPEEVKDLRPSVAWRQIKDFRNIIVHAYFGIDLEIVWDAVTKELPRLKDEMISLQKES